MIQVRRSTAIRVGFIAAVLVALGVGFGIGYAVHSPTTAPAAKNTFALKVGKVPTKGATPIVPIPTTTTARPATTTAPPVPLVMVCQGTPTYEPTTLHWCTSLCSDYMQAITWTSWTPSSASGTGTLMTNNGIPNCAQGTWTAHTDSPVTFTSPQTVPYCTNTGQSSALLFTSTNLWGGGTIPDITPPCPSQ